MRHFPRLPNASRWRTSCVAIACSASLNIAEAQHNCGRTAPSVREEYRASDAVVVGTVVRASAERLSKDFQEGTTYVVRVDERMKGKPPRQIRLFSENSPARFPMRVGAKYLLFIDNLERHVIDNCGHSGALAKRRSALATVRQLRNAGDRSASASR